MSNTSSIVLPIPSSTKDITPDWVKTVTGHDAVAEDFHLEGDIQEGIGFLSSISRVSYKTKRGEKYAIIVKLLPTNPKWLEFALSDSADEREIQFYSIVLPDLLEVIPELQENVCVYHNGAVKYADPEKGTNRASMLIVEDLKANGFEMMPFAGETSNRTVNELITFMARLHFGALAVEANKGISLPKLYPFMQGIEDNEEWTSQIESMSNEGYQQMEKLHAYNYVSNEVLDRFLKLKPHMSTLVRKIEESGRLYPCLIHGDVWPPNIQTHSENKVKILDWQLLGFRDVTIDLCIMLYTITPPEELTTSNVRRLIKRYHDEFEQLCQERGYVDKIKRRSWEEFEKFFFTWAIAFGYVIFLSSLECYAKNFAKYANVLRVICEENNLPEFLLSLCS